MTVATTNEELSARLEALCTRVDVMVEAQAARVRQYTTHDGAELPGDEVLREPYEG